MPKIFNDYGKRFFDVAFSLDQDQFVKQYSDAKPSGLYIDDHGNLKLTGQVVAFLKVAPSDTANPGSIENMDDDDDDDLTDEEIESQYKKKLNDFVDSETWEVARTIYMSFTLAGKVAIDQNFDRSTEKYAQADSILRASMNSFDVSKLDVFLGD